MAKHKHLVSDNWWRSAVIYQIYIRSFFDANNDGIGDLKGITEKLPYLAKLDVDAVWITPFFTSPMDDFGYDIADYRDVDPMFGNMADFDKLVDTAHNLGIKVIIDLALSHTSDQHSWFTESKSSKNNSKHDWYVWADAKDDGSPPNNWLSIFGGSAWEWNTKREQYYMHNFLTSQPDLNMHNRKVQDAALEVAKFWVDRKVDGFRLDTINFYFHDQELRSNPPLPVKDRNSSIAPSVNPYNYQDHLYDKNRPENIDFLKRLRHLLNENGGVITLGEIGDAQKGLEIMGQYTKGDDLVHMCYAFEFLSGDKITADVIYKVLNDFSKKVADGWACWAFSNHDVARQASRWNLSDAKRRLVAAFLFSLSGAVSIYQGEELGYKDAKVAFKDLQDPYGIQFWPEFKGRDGCRTPMAWDSGKLHGGFSTGKPWLPVSEDSIKKSASSQVDDEGSLFNHYKSLIALRKMHASFGYGSLDGLQKHNEGISFVKKTEGEAEIFCCFNFSETELEVALPKGDWKIISHQSIEESTEENKSVNQKLNAWGYLIAIKVYVK